MTGKFELKKSSSGQFHFNLTAGNGEVILSSEMYAAKALAENGIASVRVNSPLDAQYERKTSAASQPYFVLKAPNHEIIGRSEMYSSVASMENGVASVKSNAPGATLSDSSGN